MKNKLNKINSENKMNNNVNVDFINGVGHQMSRKTTIEDLIKVNKHYIIDDNFKVYQNSIYIEKNKYQNKRIYFNNKEDLDFFIDNCKNQLNIDFKNESGFDFKKGKKIFIYEDDGEGTYEDHFYTLVKIKEDGNVEIKDINGYISEESASKLNELK